MPHDVVISYSTQDKLQADAICNRLESKGIRCWIAPRDVPLGTEYAESIVQAIEEAAVMVLVYSSNADKSHQVRREVERAVSKGTTIVPVRIEDAEMSKSFELYVSSMHWLDAITPPLEKHIDKLAKDLTALLAEQQGGAAPAGRTAEVTARQPAPAAPAPAARPATTGPPPATAPAAAPKPESRRMMRWLGLLAVLAVIAALGWRIVGGREPQGPPPAEVQPATQLPPGQDRHPPGEPRPPEEAQLVFSNETPVEVGLYVFEGGELHPRNHLAPGQSWRAATEMGVRWVLMAQVEGGELVIGECAAHEPETPCPIEPLGGHELARAEFASFEGEYLGAFRQTGPGAWIEEGREGETRFEFVEEGRDEWSVHLLDPSRRDTRIQIDLWRLRILHRRGDGPQGELYRVTAAARAR